MNNNPLFSLNIFKANDRKLFLESKSYINRAKESISNCDYHKAVELLNKSIQKFTNSCEVYTLRSSAYFHLGEFDKALEDIDKVIKLKESLPKSFLQKAKILKSLKRNAEAYRILKRIENSFNSKEDTADYYQLRSSIEVDLGLFQKALIGFNQILRSNPNCPNALFGRGISKYYLGDILGSSNDLNSAIKALSQNYDFKTIKKYIQEYSCMGTIYYLAGKYNAEINNKKEALDNLFAVKEVYAITNM